MDNWLFKYFGNVYEMYNSIKYLTISIYIFRFLVANITIIIMVVRSRNSVNEISKCFMSIKSVCEWSNIFASLCTRKLETRRNMKIKENSEQQI